MMNFFDKLGKKANEAYQVTKEKTVTDIRLLNDKEKTEEIAFMIGGDTVTDVTLAQASDMIHNKK